MNKTQVVINWNYPLIFAFRLRMALQQSGHIKN